MTEVKERWASYKSKFEQVPEYVNNIASKIKKSNEINIAMWPLEDHPFGIENGDADLAFEEAVERIITAFRTKLNWMDEQISNM